MNSSTSGTIESMNHVSSSLLDDSIERQIISKNYSQIILASLFLLPQTSKIINNYNVQTEIFSISSATVETNQVYRIVSNIEAIAIAKKIIKDIEDDRDKRLDDEERRENYWENIE